MPETNKETYYRDKAANFGDKGKRQWVYADLPQGKLYTYRKITAYILLTILAVLPFIKVGGQSMFMLNFPERIFRLFGVSFWPQDFGILFITVIAFIVFIVLFTVAFGRVWCGWACPQTIFMEFIFRPIEHIIEGTPQQQKKLNEKPLCFEKVTKKLIKHIIFFVISFIISNIFLAYIIGVDALILLVTSSPLNHLSGFIALTVFAFVFYIVFSQVREIVCAFLCPYGRLQGAIVDPNSITVAYDPKRGEPRKHKGSTYHGDCIDCKKCVTVCPTGIDIRNGTQLECINCTACIDACNYVMRKTNKPEGLIRLASESSIQSGTQLKLNAKIIAYSAVLALLLGLITYLFATRSTIETTIYRSPGTLTQEHIDGKLSNLYSFKLVNKATIEQSIEFEILNNEASIQMLGRYPVIVGAENVFEGRFFVFAKNAEKRSEKIEVGIYSDDVLVGTQIIEFYYKLQ